MATKLYDDALLEKLRNWTQNTSITVVGPDETRRLFEVIADKFGDYLKRYLSEENLLKSNNFTWEVKNFCFNIVEIHFEKE